MISRILLIASVAVAVGCLFLIFGWWALLLAIPLFKRNYKRYTAYGTARWADESDLDLNAKGLLIGKLSVPRRSFSAIFNPRVKSVDACDAFWGRRKSPLVRLPDLIHCALFMPTGIGKGASFGIVHALTCEDNAVYVDVAGEFAKVAANARRKMGHRVVELDLGHVWTNTPDSLNPLDLIDADSPLALEDCRALAEALVVRTGQEREPHWCDAAEMFFAAILAFLVKYAPPHDRSLQTLRGLTANPEELEATIAVMRQSPAWDGMLARMGDSLTHFKDKELGSVMTTCARFLSFLDSPAVAKITTTSSFNAKELATGRVSVFIGVPPELVRVLIPLIRVYLTTLMLVVVKAGVQNKRLTHFVVDEAGSLGPLNCLADAIDKYRKFGVRLLLMYQSQGQLKKCWQDGADQTLLSNITSVYAGVNDLQTAEYLSARLGEETIIVQSGGTSTGRSRQTPDHGNQGSTSYSVNSNANWQQSARKLLKPEEILTLDERTAITLCPGRRPIWTTLVRYYENKRSRWKWLAHAKMFFMCLVLFVVTVVMAMCLLGINIHQLMR